MDSLASRFQKRPLAAYASFSADSVAELAENVTAKLGGTLAAVGEDRPFHAQADHFKLPLTELWFCSYDIPITLHFGPGTYFRVQFHYSGAGSTVLADREVAISADQTCISSDAATINFGPHFEQLVWRIPKRLVTQKIVELTGLPVTQPVRFEPVLNLRSRSYDTLSSLLKCLLEKIAGAVPEPNRFVLAQLEQAMLVALLCQSEHNFRSYLDQSQPIAVPWQVRRVEQYIDENLHLPVDVNVIAASIGSSTRTIFRVFHEFRGYSPGEFAKQRRLLRARTMLADSSANQSLEAIAHICGFNSVNHFSRDFSKLFGEPPSAARGKK